MKVIMVLSVFSIAVLLGWAIHPVLGVAVALLGYGVIDGLLTK